MRPAPHRDALDVLGWIKASRAQHARELVANIALEGLKGRVVKLHPPNAMLFPFRQPRLARSAHHEHDHRFFGTAWEFVFSNAHRKVDRGIRVIASRGCDLVHAQLLEWEPIAKGNVRVHQRSLYPISQRFFLRRGKLGAKVGDHAVVASQHATASAHLKELPIACVGYYHFACRVGVAVVPHSNGSAVQADTHGGGIAVETAVVGLGHDHVFHGVPRHRSRNKRPHQQASNRSIAIGKVENVRIWFVLATISIRAQPHAI